MEIISIGGKLLLAFILGAVIGLEREVNEKKLSYNKKSLTATLGLRSFSLMAVLGAVIGFIYLESIPIALLITAGFILLLLIFYFLDSTATSDIGLTTELAALYSFILGILIALEVFPIQLVIAVSIMVTLLLSKKEKIKKTVDDLGKKELNALISYAILAAVIMPFLPNINYSISDFSQLTKFLTNVGLPLNKIINIEIINPFKIWLVVVLVTGVDLISYILGKIIGEKKGWLITSAVGGFVSSTATTQSIAKESKTVTSSNYLLASAILANLASFIQIAFLIGLINGIFFSQLFKILALMMIVGLLLVIVFLNKNEKRTEIKQRKIIKGNEIIDLAGALRFAGLYLMISILSKVALSLFGNVGLLITSGFGGIIGLDAVIINTAQLAGTKITMELAIISFIIANAVNLFSKSLYSFFMGSRKFFIALFFSLTLIIATSIFGFYLK